MVKMLDDKLTNFNNIYGPVVFTYTFQYSEDSVFKVFILDRHQKKKKDRHQNNI